jgi:hypothetical protein
VPAQCMHSNRFETGAKIQDRQGTGNQRRCMYRNGQAHVECPRQQRALPQRGHRHAQGIDRLRRASEQQAPQGAADQARAKGCCSRHNEKGRCSRHNERGEPRRGGACGGRAPAATGARWAFSGCVSFCTDAFLLCRRAGSSGLAACIWSWHVNEHPLACGWQRRKPSVAAWEGVAEQK